MSDQDTRNKRWDQIQREKKIARRKKRRNPYKKHKTVLNYTKEDDNFDRIEKFQEMLDNLKT